MLISLDEALAFAERRNCAIAAVNTPFFEALLATIEVGERTNLPIILQFAQVHESIVSIEDMGPAMVELAKRSSAPFVVHVDHGQDIDYIEKGIALGFNSAMFDGSRLDLESNIRLTADVVAMCRTHRIGVEGELGVMTGNENGDPSQGVADTAMYTDPGVAQDFVRRTGVTCLAASFGTVHGIYNRAPQLNYELIRKLRDKTGVPIVMHGGSGLSAQEYKLCIEQGVRKINYYTYAAKAAYDAVVPLVNDGQTILFSDLAVAARSGVLENIGRFVNTLNNN